jgi:putative membrane protein
MKRFTIMSLLAGVLYLASACNSGQRAEDADQNTAENGAMVSPGQKNLAANEAPTSSVPDASREMNVENTDAAMKPADGAMAAADITAENFVKEAASGGMMEVELGKMASQKARNPQVKEFGQMMVNDHSKANDQLKAVASRKNLALPAKMMEKHQQHVTELAKLSGSDFDKHYMSMMVKDHQEDITKFKQASAMNDADIKNYASNTLPTLQIHLDKAQQINSALEGGTARVGNK